MSTRTKLVVLGNGMVGHRFLEKLVAGGGMDRLSVTVFCEEPRLAYDRVNLSKLFEHAEVEHSILLAGSVVSHLDGRMESSLLGRNVRIGRSDRQPRAYRFMVSDNSEIGIL